MEATRVDRGSGLEVRGPLALPMHPEVSAGDRLLRRLRRWWKQQQVSVLEDEVLERGDRASSARLTLPLVLPILAVLSVLVWREPDNQVALLCLVSATTAIVYSVLAEVLERRVAQPFWVELASCAVYATIITLLMWAMVTIEHPREHTHWIIFFVYFLLIGGMGLSDDPRLAVCAGAFSIVGYLSAVVLLQRATVDGNAMALQVADQFEWVANASKIALLAAVTFLAATSASRGRSLKRTSFRDGLTGLLNRHAFDQCLRLVGSRTGREGTQISIAMIDIDHFKRINDTYGHPTGDKVLRWMASWLDRSFRATDLVARYGGEEFVVAFPEADEQRIRDRLELLRVGIENTELRQGSVAQPIPLTISIGVASMPSEADTAEAALALADRRLYEAKHAGRNRIVFD